VFLRIIAETIVENALNICSLSVSVYFFIMNGLIIYLLIQLEY